VRWYARIGASLQRFSGKVLKVRRGEGPLHHPPRAVSADAAARESLNVLYIYSAIAKILPGKVVVRPGGVYQHLTRPTVTG
jgi:hypothetical protein